jgi:hypothetical protein
MTASAKLKFANRMRFEVVADDSRLCDAAPIRIPNYLWQITYGQEGDARDRDQQQKAAAIVRPCEFHR